MLTKILLTDPMAAGDGELIRNRGQNHHTSVDDLQAFADDHSIRIMVSSAKTFDEASGKMRKFRES